MRLSIIIPVLNEAEVLPDLLGHLASLRDSEVIVVDGGSEDDSRQAASRAGAQVIQSERGRARQMNAGAAVAQGDILLFLHADTVLQPSAEQAIANAIQRRGGAHEYAWGRFDVYRRPFIHVVGGRQPDELAFAPDRNCYRRSGHVYDTPCLRVGGRFSGSAIDGGYRDVQAAVSTVQADLPDGSGNHLRTPLGSAWSMENDMVDVAITLGILARC